MKKFIFFCCLMCVFGWQFAANQIKVSILNPSKDTVTIALMKYNTDNLSVVDTYISTENNIKKLLSDSSEKNIALYVISINKKSNIELLLSPNETAEISGTLEEFKNHDVSINKSVENEAYYKFQNATLAYETKMQELLVNKSKIPYYASNFYTLQKQLEQSFYITQEEYNSTLTSIQTIYTGTFTANEIIPLMLIPQPTPDNDTFETNRSFLHQHYFDNFKNTSDKLINHYLLTNKIDQYFSDYMEKTDDKQFIIRKIYDNTEHSLQLQNFVFDYLLTKFYKNTDDNAIQALYTVWQETTCSSNTAEDDKQKKEFIESVLKHKIGNTATNIKLSDYQQKYRALDDVVAKNKITILVFWQSSCHTCETQLPLIANMYDKYKSKKLEVFAVSLDKDMTTLKNTIAQKKYQWINVLDEKREAAKTYAIWQTPTLYVIDNSGKIIYKNIYGTELELKLWQLLQ